MSRIIPSAPKNAKTLEPRHHHAKFPTSIMNTKKLTRRCAAATIVALALLTGVAAYDKGGTAFSKRNETSLRAEPSALAPVAGKAGFAESLKIDEVRGSWLKVKGSKAAGWVFQGNVSADKPSLPPPAGLTTVSASETDTVAAARPLTPAAEGFASRHDAAESKADVEWLDAESAKVKGDEVDTWLRDNQKGEYKP